MKKRSNPGQAWLRVDLLRGGLTSWWSFRPTTGNRKVLMETDKLFIYKTPGDSLVIYIHKDLVVE